MKLRYVLNYTTRRWNLVHVCINIVCNEELNLFMIRQEERKNFLNSILQNLSMRWIMKHWISNLIDTVKTLEVNIFNTEIFERDIQLLLTSVYFIASKVIDCINSNFQTIQNAEMVKSHQINRN